MRHNFHLPPNLFFPNQLKSHNRHSERVNLMPADTTPHKDNPSEFPLKHVKSFTHIVDYEPFWSPDGQQIVLISSRHGGLKVHVMDADSIDGGKDMRQLTTGLGQDDSPAWSPDSRKIAYVSIRDGTSQIFVMNPDGTQEKQLTKGLGENIHPMWSADSNRVLFNTTHFSIAPKTGKNTPSENRVIGEKIDEQMELATIRLDGTDLKRITTGGGYTYASFSPDNRFILHRRIEAGASRIFIRNVDTVDFQNLSGSSDLDGWPAWSSDGRRVVFSRRVNESFQIFVMNRDGSGVQQITDATGEFTNPRWSPDGTRILCSRRSPPNVTLAVFQAPD